MQDINKAIKVVPKDLKDYVTTYTRQLLGYEKPPFSRLSGAVKEIQFIRAIGLKPQSAIQNLFQNINMIADIGFRKSWDAAKFAMSPRGRKMYELSGINTTIPGYMFEGSLTANPALEKVRSITSYLFSKSEEGNLRLGSAAGQLRSLEKGNKLKDVLVDGVTLAKKYHFDYDLLGTPMALRGAGGAVFQFMTYPIKQIEFLCKIAREDPKKLLRWWAVSEGVQGTAKELLDIDLSNSVGFGIDYGTALSALRAIPEGDLQGFISDMNAAIKSGGLVPTRIAPFAQHVKQITDAVSKVSPDMAEQLALTFNVQLQRLAQAGKALKEGKDEQGLYNVRNVGTDELMYRETPGQLATRTFAARPAPEVKQQETLRLRTEGTRMANNVTRAIALEIAKGNIDNALSMRTKYETRLSKQAGYPVSIDVSNSAIESAWKMLNLSPQERKRLPRNAQAFYDALNKRRGAEQK